MRQLQIFFGMLTVLLSTACAQADQPFLSSAELAEVFTGEKFRYSGYIGGNHFSGEIAYLENGNLFVDTDSGAPEGGTWRIWNDAICTKLVSLRNGQERCYSVSRTGDKRYKTSHGFSVEGPLEEAS